MAVTIDTLKAAFSITDSIQDEDLLEKLAGLCRLYNLSAEKLHTKWEAYTMQLTAAPGSEAVKLTSGTLEGFKNSLKVAAERGFQQQGFAHKKVKGLEAKAASISASLDKNSFTKMLAKKTMARSTQHVSGVSSLMPEQPSLKTTFNNETSMIIDEFPVSQPYPSSSLMNTLDTSAYQAPTKFHERKHPGRVELSYNENLMALDDGNRNDSGQPRCEITAYPGYLMSGYKYMYDKISERSNVIDGRIKSFEDVVNAEYNFEEEMGNPDQASQFSIKTVGKIMSESSAKLNEKSIMLETSSRFGAACVHLNVDGIPKFSFFPGQIVCLEGVNNTGKDVFHVHKIFDLPVPESESTNMREMYDFSHGAKYQNGGPVEIFFAAGPFTTDSGLDYEPLKCLIKAIKDSKTDLVILSGPFVSEEHPNMGDSQSPVDIFLTNAVVPIIQLLEDCLSLKVILIPNSNDLSHGWCSFPQPPFDLQAQLKSINMSASMKSAVHRLVCLPNPSVFLVNECCFAVCSEDILMDFCKEEISRVSGNDSRMHRIVKHILTQKSFYPLISTGSFDKHVAVDYGRLECAQLNVSPDVMILPSKLKCFASLIERTVACNPGVLTRGNDGGTYAKLTINAMPKENFPEDVLTKSADEVEEMYHATEGRLRIDIVRI